MKVKTALVTLAIGERYEKNFDLICRPSWTRYCEAHAFDLIIVREPLDSTARAQERSPAWQKLLVLSQDWSNNYERIVWVDSDVLMNAKAAPSIVDDVPIEKVGATDAYTLFTRSIQTIALTRLQNHWKHHGHKYVDSLTPALYYSNRDFPALGINAVVQTGVLVCSPKHHRQLFEHIYHTYEDKHGAKLNHLAGEMPAVSFELLRNNVAHWISPQFNFNVSMFAAAFYPFIFHDDKPVRLVGRAIKAIARRLNYDPQRRFRMAALAIINELSYFTHFAGCAGLMRPFHDYLIGPINSIHQSDRCSRVSSQFPSKILNAPLALERESF